MSSTKQIKANSEYALHYDCTLSGRITELKALTRKDLMKDLLSWYSAFRNYRAKLSLRLTSADDNDTVEDNYKLVYLHTVVSFFYCCKSSISWSRIYNKANLSIIFYFISNSWWCLVVFISCSFVRFINEYIIKFVYSFDIHMPICMF